MTTKPIPLALALAAGMAVLPSNGATILSPGDISIIGYSADGVDQIAFVSWKDLDSSTSINFTDRGWRNTTNSFTQNPSEDPNSSGLSPSDGTVTWVSGANVPAGTVIVATVLNNNPDTAVWNIGTSTGDFGFTGISSAGESLFAYQGSASAPSLLFGLYYYAATWSSTDPGQYSTSPSQLPSALNVPMANIVTFQVGAKDNGYYSGSMSNQSSLAAYKALVTNPANWTLSDTDTTDNLAGQFAAANFAIPEPSAIVLAALGVFGLSRRRR